MSPLEEALLRRFDKFISLFEQILDRRILDDHEKMKVEIIHLRNDVNNNANDINRVKGSAEDTSRVFVHEKEEKIKKYEESERHWTRYAVAIFVSLFITSGSALIGYLIAKH